MHTPCIFESNHAAFASLGVVGIQLVTTALAHLANVLHGHFDLLHVSQHGFQETANTHGETARKIAAS